MAVEFKSVEHLITAQNNSEQEMLQAFQNGNYTVEKPYVKVNPYIICPLTALIIFDTEEEVEVTLTVKGKEEAGDISHTFPKAREHRLPVMGLYGGCENTVIITLSNGTVSEVKMITDPIKSNIAKCTYMNTTSEYMQGNMMFTTPAGEDYASGYDYNGDCRWYLTEPFIFDMKRLRNGNVLIGSNRFIGAPYYMVGICEMSLCGKIYKEFRIPGGYHHDQFEMEDGNLLILTQKAGAHTAEDMCVLVDRNTGEIIKEWDYKKVLPQDKAKSGSWSEHDWFHNNAVWYDKKTNSLSLSGRHQDAVINIDFETGDLNWVIGDPEGWPQEMVEKYFFTPVEGKEFEWQYEQHACVILPDGDVMMFDNGHWKSKNPANYKLAKDNYSRGVRYKIDTEKMTIEQVWQFGKERGAQFFSPYICNVEYYRDGHYLVHSGGIAYYESKPCESLGAFLDTTDPKTRLNSVTVEVEDDVVKFEMHVTGNFYRAEKLKFYHEGENLVLGKGQLLGTLSVNEEFLTEVPAEETGILIPETHQAKFINEEDRIIFDAKFEKGQLVMLQLEALDGETVRRYFVPTTKMT
ncbi:MAG: aryl-sulfate sulfotransferase, partial [Cellulosilyticaceae bacterium]